MTLALRSKPANRAFERIYRAHVGDVYRYALAVTGNAADAEDVVQTTFMNAFRALERGEQPTKPRHWLIAIAHNVCRQRFRQSARRPTEVAFEDDVAEALVPSDDAPTAADIQRALNQLALNQREALVMRELEGRSYAEIAELLGLSVPAVETLLFRARRALREQLEGSLSCSEAEAALSLQLDGRLDRPEAALLRSHLRACETCRLLARRQRAQRKGLRALALVPVPPGLSSWLGAGAVGSGAAGAAATGVGAGGVGAGIGAAVVAKVAVATVAAVAVGAGGYTVVRHETATRPSHSAPSASHLTVPRTTPGHRPVSASAARQSHGNARASAAPKRPSSAAAHASSRLARRATAPALAHRNTQPSSKTKAHAGAKKPAAKHSTVAKTSHGRAPVTASTPRACGKRPTETTPVDTTTTTVATTDSSCPQPQGHGKGSANHP